MTNRWHVIYIGFDIWWKIGEVVICLCVGLIKPNRGDRFNWCGVHGQTCRSNTVKMQVDGYVIYYEKNNYS